MFCLFLVYMDFSFQFNLCNLKTPFIGQSHRVSNTRELTVFILRKANEEVAMNYAGNHMKNMATFDQCFF